MLNRFSGETVMDASVATAIRPDDTPSVVTRNRVVCFVE